MRMLSKAKRSGPKGRGANRKGEVAVGNDKDVADGDVAERGARDLKASGGAASARIGIGAISSSGSHGLRERDTGKTGASDLGALTPDKLRRCGLGDYQGSLGLNFQALQRQLGWSEDDARALASPAVDAESPDDRNEGEDALPISPDGLRRCGLDDYHASLGGRFRALKLKLEGAPAKDARTPDSHDNAGSWDDERVDITPAPETEWPSDVPQILPQLSSLSSQSTPTQSSSPPTPIASAPVGREIRCEFLCAAASEHGTHDNMGYYDGRLDHTGKPLGHGTFRWDNGVAYVGECLDGKPDGHGAIKFPNGEYYDGGWSDGEHSGRGTCRFENGGVYVGDWRDSAPHGRGTMTLPSGIVYSGSWRGGKWHGLGKVTLPDGGAWEGTFRGGKCALGTFRRTNGELEVGRYDGLSPYDIKEGVWWSAGRDEVWTVEGGKKVERIDEDKALEEVAKIGMPLPPDLWRALSARGVVGPSAQSGDLREV
ncbi:hypothetical protein ACHAWF_016545 [Thalassiosira exigua]